MLAKIYKHASKKTLKFNKGFLFDSNYEMFFK